MYRNLDINVPMRWGELCKWERSYLAFFRCHLKSKPFGNQTQFYHFTSIMFGIQIPTVIVAEATRSGERYN